jgi:hypothetical protein
MTPADLADLTARVTILERIVRAIEAFDDCYYETDVHDCERELRAALKARRGQNVDVTFEIVELSIAPPDFGSSKKLISGVTTTAAQSRVHSEEHYVRKARKKTWRL